jgi:hypothetical protein
MLRPSAENRIEPQAEESGDHGQDDDFDNHVTKPVYHEWARRAPPELSPCCKK